MSKTILIVGFGPGVSAAVAERFGAEGFQVALVARDAGRLAAGVEALKARGVAAAAFPADAADPAAVRTAIGQARAMFGPLSVLHWNAIGGLEAGDLMAADPAARRRVFDIAVFGLLSAVQEALGDLRAAGDGAVLVTNGAFGEIDEGMDALAVSLRTMGLAVANAAKHKLVGLLAERLKGEGVHVGEVMIAGPVRGTPSDTGGAAIEAAGVADLFWGLYRDRKAIRARIAPA